MGIPLAPGQEDTNPFTDPLFPAPILNAQRWAVEHGVLPPPPDPEQGITLGWDKPPAPQVAPDGAVQDQKSIPAVSESPNNLNDSANTEFGLERYMLGGQLGPSGPTNEIMPEGENYLPVGGAGGKDLFQETFVDTPQRFAQASRDEAGAEADLGKARANVIQGLQDSQGAQLAAIEQRRKEREAGEMQRQQQLDAATERYSNDLADTGKFWRNPGSIFAAIGAFMMGLSGKNDTNKVLNDAVMADWNQRREIANQHLGELKSNLASYRQITGDATRGDQMALSESYRIAAMELERISSQFQGPIAKARAEKGIQGLMQQSNIIRMNAYKQGVYNQPHIVKPGITKAYAAGGQAYPGVGYTPFGKPPSAGTPAAAGPKASIPVGKLDAAIGALGGTSSTKNIDKSDPELSRLVDERAGPGTSALLNEYKVSLWSEARDLAGAAGITNPASVRKEARQAWKNDQKEAGEIQQNIIAQTGWDLPAWRSLQSDVQALKSKLGPDANSYMTGLRMFAPDWSDRLNELRRAYGDRSTPEAKAEMQKLDAAEQFHQKLAFQIAHFGKQEAGSAQSKQELARLAKVISETSDFGKTVGFIQLGATSAQDAWNQALGRGGPRAQILVRVRNGLTQTRPFTPGYTAPKDSKNEWPNRPVQE